MRRSREESSQPDYNITYRHPLQNVTFAHRIIMFAGQYKKLATPIRLSLINKSFREAAVVFNAAGKSWKANFNILESEFNPNTLTAGLRSYQVARNRMQHILYELCCLREDAGYSAARQIVVFLPDVPLTKYKNFDPPLEKIRAGNSIELFKLFLDAEYGYDSSSRSSYLEQGTSKKRTIWDEHDYVYRFFAASVVRYDMPFLREMLARRAIIPGSIDNYERFMKSEGVVPAEGEVNCLDKDVDAETLMKIEKILHFVINVVMKSRLDPPNRISQLIHLSEDGDSVVLRFLLHEIGRRNTMRFTRAGKRSFVSWMKRTCATGLVLSLLLDTKMIFFQEALLNSADTFQPSFAMAAAARTGQLEQLKALSDYFLKQKKYEKYHRGVYLECFKEVLLIRPSEYKNQHKLNAPDFEKRGGFPFWRKMLLNIREIANSNGGREMVHFGEFMPWSEEDGEYFSAFEFVLRKGASYSDSPKVDSKYSVSPETENILKSIAFLDEECFIDLRLQLNEDPQMATRIFSCRLYSPRVYEALIKRGLPLTLTLIRTIPRDNDRHGKRPAVIKFLKKLLEKTKKQKSSAKTRKTRVSNDDDDDDDEDYYEDYGNSDDLDVYDPIEAWHAAHKDWSSSDDEDEDDDDV